MIAFEPGRRKNRKAVLRTLAIGILASAAIMIAFVAPAAMVIHKGGASKPAEANAEAAVLMETPVARPPAGPDPTLPAAYPKPLTISIGPRTASAVVLHIGPSPDYVVLGTLQEGAPLDVVGRDETGEWVAIVFPPNSTFRAWLPVAQALDVSDVQSLPVEPVKLLP